MSKRNPFVSDASVYNCPYRYKCGCYCALSVKTYSDKVEVALAGEHTVASHTRSSGVLSVKQRSAVKMAVRSSPHAVGSQVHASLENFSPGKRVPFDSRSQKAVARLVPNERKELMAKRVPGIDIYDTAGSMKRLADSICLIKLIARHNDPADDFHMDEHQVVQVGHQFKDGVTFMTVTTPHLLNNMARGDNCNFETQGHFDGAFNWCNKDFALTAFGMNDPNDVNQISFKEIKVLCEKYNVPFKNKTFTQLVTQIRVKYFDELKGRIKFSKEFKQR
jgi:hypothetical protein